MSTRCSDYDPQSEITKTFYKTVQNMMHDGATEFIEVGPGTALQGMIKRVDANANAHSAE